MLLVGCSRVSIAYRTADIFIEAYADDYLTLDRMQLAGWRPALADALARHRKEELPYLARFFDTAHGEARDGFTARGMDCLLEQLDDLYRRHVEMVVDLAVPLLADLSPEQVRALEARFAEDNAEPPEETPAEVARRERKRAERYAKNLEWWLGSVSAAQNAVIAEVTDAMPDTAVAWETYRAAKQAGLVALLDRGASEAELHRYLHAWLVEHRDMPPALRADWERIRRGIHALFLRVDATLSAEQRRHFAQRLADIRNDFMSLQERPRMADVTCARPA